MPADQVKSVAAATGAIPYDVPDVEYTHFGEYCSFDAFLKKHDLTDPALQKLAVIVRGADTGRLELAAEAAGLLAISRGLNKIIEDDHALLAQGMIIYDALYAWCKEAVP